MANANRLYSFRFPVDAAVAFQSLRDKLVSALGGTSSYEQLVQKMSDRDRALEDHLNFSVSQGRLGYVQTTSLFQQWTAAQSDVRDLGSLSVTVNLPANRVVRISGQALFQNQNDGTAALPPSITGLITVDGTALSAFGFLSVNIQTLAAVKGALQVCAGSIIVTPAAGAHTFKLQGQGSGTGAGQCNIQGTSAVPAFILVEDLGPVNT